MNTTQQSLVAELFDRAIMENEELAQAHADYTPSDYIFIKNLENVQGDERDIIIKGFTYGPDPTSRRVYPHFGPIASDGGWHRLNVLFIAGWRVCASRHCPNGQARR